MAKFFSKFKNKKFNSNFKNENFSKFQISNFPCGINVFFSTRGPRLPNLLKNCKKYLFTLKKQSYTGNMVHRKYSLFNFSRTCSGLFFCCDWYTKSTSSQFFLSEAKVILMGKFTMQWMPCFAIECKVYLCNAINHVRLCETLPRVEYYCLVVLLFFLL
jgi:hypothetical protein